MIYTCTMNPAIDLFSEFTSFDPFVVNRSIFEEYQPNGKAINISFMLKKLGISNMATGFLGGFTGDFIEQELEASGIETAFIKVDGITRINTFIRENSMEYKAVNRGPVISQQAQELLIEQIRNLKSGDWLFVSGSLPQGIDDQIHIEIAKIAHQLGVKLVLDISSSVLLDCLAYEPYLIKPNDEEIANWFNIPDHTDRAELQKAAEQLLERGAQRVLLSCGAQGALYCDSTQELAVNAPSGKIVNTACAGDTMLAAFAGRLMLGDSEEEALVYATAAGSSTAFTSGLSDLSDIPDLAGQIQIKRKWGVKNDV
ncbi:1-phosphofructokinase [Terribacillus saccharophilus]|uniref:Tagatose-6-phosphate kinase n=1 Tax=Terribacillus saccharophilus TaxID=361277 RepID=A0A268HEX7_9BACI|nr:1-phosphofructokinase [Terribacillus saccharophilus]PAE08400.1 1-phosphofructokinase [Terribacillus saccharophilus]